jgi:hypothetical protein
VIRYHGRVDIPRAVVLVADSIKLLNYRTSTPARFRKDLLSSDLAGVLMSELSKLIGVESSRLDYVYFSVCCGAEPHVDILDSSKFLETTFVVPVILPSGRSIITAESTESVVEVGGVYEFNHEREHSMVLEDVTSGCVVIMVAIRREHEVI